MKREGEGPLGRRGEFVRQKRGKWNELRHIWWEGCGPLAEQHLAKKKSGG